MLKEEFVEKSIKVHGDKYIYDKIPNEFRANDDVIIICPIHGEFTQCARTHYRGGGCPKCGIEKAKVSKLLTTESFLKKYHDKFGDIYDTSLVVYKDFETDVIMICPKHGEFKKTPHALMRGEGCPKCGRESSIEKRRLSRDEVIQRANEIHNFKYNYEKYNGEKLSEEVTIICPIHGEFKQTMR
jgi:predicted nucleic-acid-binding Zn-ribbon protein